VVLSCFGKMGVYRPTPQKADSVEKAQDLSAPFDFASYKSGARISEAAQIGAHAPLVMHGADARPALSGLYSDD